ncbi:MAG: Rpn family recombination-promoting nuclease/putative transposase [Ruminococcus sp.]|nr:Rpn family recombination-promoting nuclease/putative transposase [Ruminococcus sp.]
MNRGEKYARLDIIVTQPDGKKFNVELQNRDEHNYKERSVFNCSKLFTRDVKAGDEYKAIPKTICINILQFKLFKNDRWRCTVYPIIEETGEVVTPKWEIIYFQTPFLPKDKSSSLIEWLTFFTLETKSELTLMKEYSENRTVHKALEVVEMMNNFGRLKEIARAREEAHFNEWWQLGSAKQAGIEIGEANRNFEIAKNLASLGVSLELIMKATGLSVEDIQNLNANTE